MTHQMDRPEGYKIFVWGPERLRDSTSRSLRWREHSVHPRYLSNILFEELLLQGIPVLS